LSTIRHRESKKLLIQQMSNSLIARNRFVFGALMLGIMLLGLASRRFLEEWSFVKLYVGDVLWALMVYFGFALLFHRWAIWAVAAVAYGFSVCIELSQLYHAPWIDNLRATRLGGLVLGFSFVWSDLLCYAVGVCLGILIETYCIPARYRLN
jgi:hypothetical protein